MKKKIKRVKVTPLAKKNIDILAQRLGSEERAVDYMVSATQAFHTLSIAVKAKKDLSLEEFVLLALGGTLDGKPA